MTIPDLIKDLIDNSKERLKNPLSGAFLWSFIIFNWRPLFFLMFSDLSIEHKIIDINYNYCNWYAIIIPLIMALFFTMAIPYLMLQIENVLQNTNGKRIENTYKIREVKMDGKITLADKEYILKNKLSGNKEMQNLLDENEGLKEQVNSLQEIIQQLNDSNTATMENLNITLKKLSESNNKKDLVIDNLTKDNEIYKIHAPHLNEELVNNYNVLLKKIRDKIPNMPTRLQPIITEETEKLNINELVFLKRIKTNNRKEILIYLTDEIPILESLVEKSIVKVNGSKTERVYTFSEAGSIIYDMLQDKI